MEGKVVSRLISEDDASLLAGEDIYHPLWGFGKVREVDEDSAKVEFRLNEPDPKKRIRVEGPLPYLFVLLRRIVFKQRYIHGTKIDVKLYPVPVRFWETARNKGWLDHPKYIEADIMDGVAILHGVCKVGCN